MLLSGAELQDGPSAERLYCSRPLDGGRVGHSDRRARADRDPEPCLRVQLPDLSEQSAVGVLAKPHFFRKVALSARRTRSCSDIKVSDGLSSRAASPAEGKTFRFNFESSRAQWSAEDRSHRLRVKENLAQGHVRDGIAQRANHGLAAPSVILGQRRVARRMGHGGCKQDLPLDCRAAVMLQHH
jgi:hypothetical protein